MDKNGLVLYAVRNKEGKWFRRKGFGGYGDTWVEDFYKARVYAKVGGARSVVSWFASHHPAYGVPDLVALEISSVRVIDEKARVEAARQKKALQQRAGELRHRQGELRRAEGNLEKARQDLEAIRGRA
jgi:hypothetical protein